MRVSLLDSNPDDPPPARFHDVAADDGVSSPIGTLDEHVRLQSRNDPVRSVFVKDDGASTTVRPASSSARSASGVNWPVGAFVGANRSVRIDTDDERVAFLARGGEIPDVSRVEQIEDAIRENDNGALARGAAYQLRGLLE